MTNKPKQSEQAAAPPAAKAPRTILSRDLLGNDKLVIIRHDREDYRLQVTSTGKLILTK
jgi:hemin uptake protein HemP